MSKTTETTLEINLDALTHNYHYLRSKLNEHTKLLAVVKAYAYGGEPTSIAQHLEGLGVDYFAVAYAQEGAILRDAGITTPILVLHPLPDNFDLLVERCLEPSLYSQNMLDTFIAFTEKKHQTDYPIHLKFNTGLNRLGFTETDVSVILKKVALTKAIKVRSLLSHLAASEDASETVFTKNQIACFDKISETLKSKLPQPFYLHILNTSGIINFPEAQYDMVRTGIGLYGYGNEAQIDKELQPVFTLKTVISQIHTLQKGATVGYSRAFKVDALTRIATLPLGHADGISRAYGNGVGWVTVHGKKAPIAGNVCMDMIMVNVTGIDCKEGDEVTVFGSNPDANALANAIGSISYELLTAISQRVKRTVVRKNLN